MIRCYKFRLFPNINQTRELERTLETHRRLYNRALDGKMLCLENNARWTLYDQQRWFSIQRSMNRHYAAVDCHSARMTLKNLDRAFESFFRHRKSTGARRAGFPKFKSVEQFSSFAFDSGFRLVERKLRLHHIGTLRVRWHRELPNDGTIKTVTIKREAGKWFACFAVKCTKTANAPQSARVGIDIGLKSFVATSEGEHLGDSRSLERALPELRRRQRAMFRCTRNSNRYHIARTATAKVHAKVRNARRDMHHKVSRSLVNRYGLIVAERLNINGMLKNRKLSRRIGDAAWYSFIQILANKAAESGGCVELVDPHNTSQECSECGTLVRKSLAVRVHKCDQCGCELDRDVNAARNILARAVPKDANASDGLHCPKSRFQLVAK